MEFDLKTMLFIGTQIAIVTTLIQSNRIHVKSLQEANDELKSWLKDLQEKVTAIRIKLGE